MPKKDDKGDTLDTQATFHEDPPAAPEQAPAPIAEDPPPTAQAAVLAPDAPIPDLSKPVFDFDAWADALPAVVVLDRQAPAYLNDAGETVRATCARQEAVGPCWGRIASLQHPMARHPTGEFKDQSQSAHTCRGHFWLAQKLGPYVALPKAFRPPEPVTPEQAAKG